MQNPAAMTSGTRMRKIWSAGLPVFRIMPTMTGPAIAPMRPIRPLPQAHAASRGRVNKGRERVDNGLRGENSAAEQNGGGDQERCVWRKQREQCQDAGYRCESDYDDGAARARIDQAADEQNCDRAPYVKANLRRCRLRVREPRAISSVGSQLRSR